jgi:multiple sugar transport system ATP-binding protein
LAEITLDGVWKVYPDGTEAVKDFSLGIGDGEFMVFVGPSGCGKTTALRMVAGLEDISKGSVSIGDRVVNDVPPKDRDVAMVFQNYALYPHMSVADNMGFGLKLQKVDKREIEKRVREAAGILGLEEFLKRKPRALSGGQRQRVAMGRAIVREPQAFLMDEPLSNLDAKLRVQMRAEIARLQRELKTTTIYVTHDQVEALTMGDRVAVLRDGTLQQVADPETLYNEPANLFVAAFIGSPAMNLLEATFVEEDDGTARAILDEQSLTVPPEVVADNPGLRDHVGGRVVVGIRPEHIFDAGLHDPRGEVPGARLRAEVELREALGSELVMHLRTAAHRALTDDTRSAADADEAVLEEHERQAETGEALLVARFDARSRARIGDKVELAVDTSQLHFFDPETGLRLSQLPEPDPVEVADPADEVVEGDEVVEVVEVADPADEVAEGDGEETAGTAEA